ALRCGSPGPSRPSPPRRWCRWANTCCAVSPRPAPSSRCPMHERPVKNLVREGCADWTSQRIPAYNREPLGPSVKYWRNRMAMFKSPMINLYSRDLPRAVAFYSELGFIETFRTPTSGEPTHIQLKLDGFSLGIATVEAAREHHGLRPEGEGRWIEIVLWTDDADRAVSALVAKGAPLLSPSHDFLAGKLRAAWIADPDGN